MTADGACSETLPDVKDESLELKQRDIQDESGAHSLSKVPCRLLGADWGILSITNLTLGDSSPIHILRHGSLGGMKDSQSARSSTFTKLGSSKNSTEQ